MTELLKIFLSLSLSGSILILFLFVCNFFLKEKMSRQWQYYIWLVVIARLLLPFSTETSILGSLFQGIDNTVIQSEPVSLLQQTKTNLQDMDFTTSIKDESKPSDIKQPTDNKPIRDVIILFSNNIWLIWLFISFILLVHKITVYQSFIRYVKAGQTPVNAELLDEIALIGAKVGVKRPVELCVNPLISSPLLTGFTHPCIVIPSIDIKKQNFKYIIHHELTHYRRFDMFYKWLVQITVCLHWFNPLIYLMEREINKACEFSCDEAIISKLGLDKAKEYGRTLLDAMSMVGKYKESFISITLSENKNLIKERIGAIMKFKKPSKVILIGTIILSVFLCCSAVYMGVYATENKNTEFDFSPIRIKNIKINPGGKLSLGAQQLHSGIKYNIYLTWSGNEKLTVLIHSLYEKNSINIESGKRNTFCVDADGLYTIAVKNMNKDMIKNVYGFIYYKQDDVKQQLQNKSNITKSKKNSQTVRYESVIMRKYPGSDGHPYIYDIMTNYTVKDIVGYQQGMLAFDKKGKPLKIDWYNLDTDLSSTYFYLYKETSTKIAAGETMDKDGGWSLNVLGKDKAVNKIAYVLYCHKEITFDDGTIWKNPEFKKWRSTYEGKKIKVSVLNNYYPFEQKIIFKASK